MTVSVPYYRPHKCSLTYTVALLALHWPSAWPSYLPKSSLFFFLIMSCYRIVSPSGTFCDHGNVCLTLCSRIWESLVTDGSWECEMWLVRPRNWIFKLNLDSDIWLMVTVVDSKATGSKKLTLVCFILSSPVLIFFFFFTRLTSQNILRSLLFPYCPEHTLCHLLLKTAIEF